MIDSSVDLPQPEWPRMQTNSPSKMRALTSSMAVNGPVGVGKTLLMDESSRGAYISRSP
jgi:hypothetical protein